MVHTMKAARTPVVVRLAEPGLQRLDLVCGRRGLSRSEALREALGAWLDVYDRRAAPIAAARAAVIPTAAGLPAVVEEPFDPWADLPEAPAVNPGVEPEQPVWGTDRYGRPQWQGPVDADGNPDPGDAA